MIGNNYQQKIFVSYTQSATSEENKNRNLKDITFFRPKKNNNTED